MLSHTVHSAPRDIVLVHGAGGNALLWKRTVQHLSGEMNAVSVDLPGHPSGAITCTTIDQYVEAVSGFLKESGLRKPVVCGHSMGSAISLKLALAHPGELGGLILVSGGAKMGVDPVILQGLKGVPMRTIEQVITPRSFQSLDLGLGREARKALSISNLPVFLNDYLACNGYDVREELPRVSVPTLVVCGDKDQMTPPRWSHFLHENIPGSELRFVKDSGHMLPLERPEALAAVVQSFLSGLTR